MGSFDFLKPRAPNTATVAKQRLRIMVAQERAQRDAPDYLPMLRRAGLAVGVADAHPALLEAAHWITRAPGGRGAVREVCDLLLSARAP